MKDETLAPNKRGHRNTHQRYIGRELVRIMDDLERTESHKREIRWVIFPS